MLTEKELVIQLKTAKEKRDALDKAFDQAKAEYADAEYSLVEYLEAKGATATATYEGLGYAQLQKPRLHARCAAEHIDQLFAYLKEQGREDLIKTTVMPQTLSAYVKECIEQGLTFPDYIEFCFKPAVRLYA